MADHGAPSSAAAGAGPEADLWLGGGELLAWRRRCLRDGGRPEEFDWLLDLGGGVPWRLLQKLHLRPETPVRLQRSPADLEALWQEHRQRRVPLQYLVGCCPWRDFELRVAPGVLIPRQETELLVDLALSLPRPGPDPGSRPPVWADLGTGSGAIAVAMARSLPHWRGFAVDRSPEALRQAGANIRRLAPEARVDLLLGDWWEPLRQAWGEIRLAIANPPYIPSDVHAALDPLVRDHEPPMALDGGADGLDAIRAIVAGAPAALACGGRLLLEHQHDQSPRVLQLMRGAGLRGVRAACDLEGHARFASGTMPQAPCLP